MVVLAAAIVTKGGKPLLSRQFLGLPRSRLESLLGSFPRLVHPTAEHTVLEASGVRFLYTPLEHLYVLLITNTQSNILLDLQTLNLVTRIVTDWASGGRGGAVTEQDVAQVSFQILSAWDEVITLGWRENVNLAQVRSVLEMESHEEKIQEIIARNKEQEAKEELKRRAKQLEMQRRDMTRRGQNPYSANSSSGFANSNSPASSVPAYDQRSTANFSQLESDRAASTTRSAAAGFKTKGMQLGSKSNKESSVLAQALGGLNIDEPLAERVRAVEREEQVQTPTSAPTPTAGGAGRQTNPFGEVEESDVHLVLRETLSLSLARDGGLQSLSLKGDLDLRISNADLTNLVISLPPAASYAKNSGSNDLQFKTHPNVDKKSWSDKGEIRLKEGKKGFPVGQGLGVLKWRMTGKDESVVPISINCWPSTSNGTCTINLEYDLESPLSSLTNLTITIPIPAGSAAPRVDDEPSTGSYHFDEERNEFVWNVGFVDEDNGNGSLEFFVEGDDTDGFFPVAVEFVSQRGLCGVEVLSVQNPVDESEVEYSIDSLLSTDEYLVV